MKINKQPFLSSFISDFKIGDLIYWVEFDQDENYALIKNVRHGAIVDIKKKCFVGDTREVFYASVLPFGETNTIELALHLLKKIN